MLTISLLLILAAFVIVVLGAWRGQAPLWVAVLLLVLERLLSHLPLR